MWLLAAAVVLFGALTTLNLILTLGVIRRLREQGELLTTQADDRLRVMIEAGRSPAAFSASTVDGETLTEESLVGPTLLAFVSPECDACQAQVPVLLERAAMMPGGSGNVLVVVNSRDDDALTYAEKFRKVARVVVEPASGPVTKAFDIGGWPAFGLLDAERRMVASAVTVDRIDLPVAL